MRSLLPPPWRSCGKGTESITRSPRYCGNLSKEHQEGRDLRPFGPARTRGNLAMLATWIETAAKGRLGGPVRAGMWSAAVIGTHPVQDNQRVLLELAADDVSLGPVPAYWIENKGGNSFWHAPIPPQGVGIRLHYRSIVERENGELARSVYQDTI